MEKSIHNLLKLQNLTVSGNTLNYLQPAGCQYCEKIIKKFVEVPKHSYTYCKIYIASTITTYLSNFCHTYKMQR